VQRACAARGYLQAWAEPFRPLGETRRTMLKVDTKAPQFVARAVDGNVVSMRALSGKPLIVYFFHKAFTPNCTIETKGFRDNYEELRTYGYEVIGISTDSEETQCRFAEKHAVTYPMIADQDRSLSRLYDVLWPLIPYARRVAYVLDAQQTIRAVFRHEFQASKHLDEILRFARLAHAAQPHAQV
jgi:peroxiredoxin Q/BCP